MPDERSEMEAFCAATFPKLVGALSLHTGDRDLAEELAQEALLRACRRWSKVRQLESPGGWAYRVGVNLASNHFRRLRSARRARSRLHRSGHTEASAAGDVVDSMVVRQALQELTEPQRQAVVLRYYLDLSVRQTADVIGSSPGAVRGLTHRAIKVLRGHDGLDFSVPSRKGSADVS